MVHRNSQIAGTVAVRIVLPLALSEPEPTLPFGLSLSEPTYQHLPTFFNLLNINFTEKLLKIISFQCLLLHLPSDVDIEYECNYFKLKYKF